MHRVERGGDVATRAAARGGNPVALGPADHDVLRILIGCSVRWALELTQKARDAKLSAENAAIEAGKAAGKSNRKIAQDLGVDERTVRRRRGAADTHSAQAPHSDDETAAELLSEPDPAEHGFDHLFGNELDAAFRWINELHRRYYDVG